MKFRKNISKLLIIFLFMIIGLAMFIEILFSQSSDDNDDKYFELQFDQESYENEYKLYDTPKGLVSTEYKLENTMPDISLFKDMIYNDVSWSISMVISYLEKNNNSNSDSNNGYSKYNMCSPSYVYSNINSGLYKNTIIKGLKLLESKGCLSIEEERKNSSHYKRFLLKKGETRRLTQEFGRVELQDMYAVIDSIMDNIPVIVGCKTFYKMNEKIKNQEYIHEWDIDIDKTSTDRGHTMIITAYNEEYKDKYMAFKVMSPLKDEPFWITKEAYTELILEAYRLQYMPHGNLSVEIILDKESKGENVKNIVPFRKEGDENYMYINEKIKQNDKLKSNGDYIKINYVLTNESSNLYVINIPPKPDNKVSIFSPAKNKNAFRTLNHENKPIAGKFTDDHTEGKELILFILTGYQPIDIYYIQNKEIDIVDKNTIEAKEELVKHLKEDIEPDNIDLYILELETIK